MGILSIRDLKIQRLQVLEFLKNHYKLISLNIFSRFQSITFIILIDVQSVPFWANKSLYVMAPAPFRHDLGSL